MVEKLSKQAMIDLWKQTERELGKQPNSREFYKLAKINRRQLDEIFGKCAWNQLVSAAGGITKEAVGKDKKWTDEAMLEAYGKAIREIGQHPTQAEWLHQQRSPSVAWYQEQIGRWSELPNEFRKFADGRDGWGDVLSMIPQPVEAAPVEQKDTDSSIPKYAEFIPPPIAKIPALASSGDSSYEFEKLVNVAFEILGFDVKDLGQGAGTEPDGIAFDYSNGYAALVDAKARTYGYSLGTDYRAFAEYITRWGDKLNSKGVRRHHLVIVSSSFNHPSDNSISKIRKAGASSVSMISAKILALLVGFKIRYPILFTLKEFESNVLLPDGTLKDELIKKLIKDLGASR